MYMQTDDTRQNLVKSIYNFNELISVIIGFCIVIIAINSNKFMSCKNMLISVVFFYFVNYSSVVASRRYLV